MNIRPFLPLDFVLVESREEAKINPHDTHWLGQFFYDRSFYQYKGHTRQSAFTATSSDGIIIGCAGVALMFGVGELWMNASHKLVEHPLRFHRLSKHLLHKVIHEANLHRVETAIAKSKPKNRRWICSLGLCYDGIAVQFGPDGEDFVRFAWVRG